MNETTRHQCTGCEWWLDTTFMSSAQIDQLVHEHMREDHAPPTPAPARERRAGQRWRYENDAGGEFVLLEWDAARARWRTSTGVYWSDDCWGHGSVWKLTLLVDAPATSEPGRAACPHGHRHHCADCDIARAIAASRPTQEAAKAEPRCGSCVKSHPTVTARVRKGGKMLLCEPCMLAAEKAQGDWVEGPRIKDLPSRLPRPRLAHSAMWADWAEDAR